MSAEARRLAVVQSTVPDPPYPAELRARGFTLPIDWERIEQSTSWIKCPAPMRPWLLMLWTRSWLSAPAGTYPNDDEEIAARIGMPDRDFAANRDFLMRGWYVASDGRFYHDFISKLVLEMAESRAKDRKRMKEWRKNQRAMAGTVTRDKRERSRDSRERDSDSRLVARENDTGTGTGTGTGVTHPSDASTTQPPVPKGRKAKTTTATSESPREGFAIPDWLDADAWRDFVDFRKAKRSPMTPRAKELAVMKLDTLRQLGHDPAAVLQQSILNGWTSLLPIKADAKPAGALSEAGNRAMRDVQHWIERKEREDEAGRS